MWPSTWYETSSANRWESRDHRHNKDMLVFDNGNPVSRLALMRKGKSFGDNLYVCGVRILLLRNRSTFLRVWSLPTLHRSDSSRFSLSEFYVTLEVPPPVFDSSYSKDVSLIEVWGTWPLKVGFWLLKSFRVTSLFLITTMFIVPHFKPTVKTVL